MIRVLPLFMGLVPIIGVSVAYWVNIRAGVLPACMPPLDGCVSISATGRYMPGSLPFRAVLLPQAAFLAFFWWLGIQWLRQVAPSYGFRRTIFVCGLIGAVSLVIYVTFLGTKQPIYEFMRRFGIYFYFLGTALSQVLLTLAIPKSRLSQLMLVFIVTPFILGLLNLALKVFIEDSNNFENRIEWISALLMQIWFMLLYFVWRKSGFVLSVRTDSSNARS